MFQLPQEAGDDEYAALLRRAVSVTATEMAVFAVSQGFWGKTTLQPLVHVRPGDSTPETRRAAIAAFEEIVLPCVKAGRDRAIEVCCSDAGLPPQYCLVTLARRGRRLVGAAAFIARFASGAAAQAALTTLQRGAVAG